MNNQEVRDLINSTPELQSLLYNLDLLPDQLKEDSIPWCKMLSVVGFYQKTKAKYRSLAKRLFELASQCDEL